MKAQSLIPHQTYHLINRRLGAGEGFLSRLPDDGVRPRNSHMHFAEACLAAFDATRDERFLDQTRKLFALFRRRMFDGETLGERFSATCARTPAQVLEPGHHFEWVWILAQHQRLSGDHVAAQAQALVDWSERCGVERASGAVYDAVWRRRSAPEAELLTWTNTQWIKGWLGLHEVTGCDPSEAVVQTLDLLFDRHFAGSLPGAWVGQFDMEGRALAQAVPALIVYHLLLAFSEVLRLASQLGAKRP